MNQKRVAVIMGGLSNEREISLASGKGVTEALIKRGYITKSIDLTDDISLFIQQIQSFKPDIVFNALHGRYGEDGCVQGLLNLLHIPYTHSGVTASAIGMDKQLTRQIAKQIGVPVAEGGLKTKQQMLEKPFPLPYVAKPNDDGSSIGVHLIKTMKQHQDFIKHWEKDKAFLIESYIPGRELSVAILNNKPLGTIELVPQKGFYDYKNKYTAGKTTHLIPAPLPKAQRALVEKYALLIHQALGCRGVSRSDFRYDDSNSKRPRLIFLEINTNPGMTPFSLVPDIAKSKKITYDKLVEQILKEATCD